MTSTIDVLVAGFRLAARLETEAAPRSCAAFLGLLPLRARLVQARWSGEAAWIPLGDLDLHLPYENATSYPGVGQLLLHPGSISDAEILFPYGTTVFGSKVGQLAGNHFATIEDGLTHLTEIGRRILWEGAQDASFEAR